MSFWDSESEREQQRQQFIQAIMAQQQATVDAEWHHQALQGLGMGTYSSYSPATQSMSGGETLMLIKKSIKQIKTEAVGENAQTKIKTKIDRLLDLGALAQATILDAELQLRQKLYALSEWDYKVLPYDSIKEFEKANQMTAIKDGLRVRIDSLEKFDKIMPDNVLDELEKAKDRKLFDEFVVLSVEKVKDPLLLGQINGCKDYFLLAEWGDDITFDELVKEGN